jgi:TatD DNase family protein
MYIDTHAHLYLPEFSEDLAAVLERARDAGVSKILMPNIDLNSAGALHQVEEEHSELCQAMMGLHPCSIDDGFETVLAQIEGLIKQRDYIAIGEIGIDLYWDKTFFSQQVEAFRIQAGWAHERDWPIVIHSRDSIDEILEILEGLNLPGLRGVFHCFTGNRIQAERIMDLGFLMGIGGVVTFKNSGLAEVLTFVDPQSLVLETDAPYLAPHPHRGKRNESSYIPLIAGRLADIYGMDTDTIGQTTTRQATALFDL